MLLQCETEDGAAGEGTHLTWLRPGTLESLVQLNEACLALLAEQAAVRSAPASPLLRQVGELWRVLDAGARRRAAACPYLLLDAGCKVDTWESTYLHQLTGEHPVLDPEHRPGDRGGQVRTRAGRQRGPGSSGVRD